MVEVKCGGETPGGMSEGSPKTRYTSGFEDLGT